MSSIQSFLDFTNCQKQIKVSSGPFWPRDPGVYFTNPGAQSKFIDWCYTAPEQIWPRNNYKIIQKQRTNPPNVSYYLCIGSRFSDHISYVAIQFCKLNLVLIIGECVGISLIVLRIITWSNLKLWNIHQRERGLGDSSDVGGCKRCWGYE